MAETQRVSRASSPPLRQRPAPKPRHPPYAVPLRLPLDQTQDLRPPAPTVEPEAVQEEPQERHALSPRTPAEQALLTVLVLGLALNAVLLLIDSTLTRADILLGSTVLLSGVVLLTLLEICRRGGPARR
jgi:hypothetical protein